MMRSGVTIYHFLNEFLFLSIEGKKRKKKESRKEMGQPCDKRGQRERTVTPFVFGGPDRVYLLFDFLGGVIKCGLTGQS